MTELPAAVLFDFDGLILDTETPAYVTAAEVFADHGVELSRDEWVEIIGTADHPHWTELLADALGAPLEDPEAIVAARRDRHDAVLLAQPLQPGVVELAEAARHSGVGVAVASSSPLDWVAGHLDRFGIGHLFPVRATRDDVGRTRTKPHPDLFVLAAARLGVDPTRCVVLEDSEPGIAAANAAGCVSVAVPRGMTAHCSFSHADLVVDAVADLDLDRLASLFEGSRVDS